MMFRDVNDVDRIHSFYIAWVMSLDLSIEWDALYAWPHGNGLVWDIGPICVYMSSWVSRNRWLDLMRMIHLMPHVQLRHLDKGTNVM